MRIGRKRQKSIATKNVTEINVTVSELRTCRRVSV